MKRQVHLICRHNIDERTSYLPWPVAEDKLQYWPQERLDTKTPVYKGEQIIGYEGSRRSDIEWAKIQKQPFFGRMDIVLINLPKECICSKCNNHHEAIDQFAIYPGPNGTITGDIDKLTPEEKEWALKESAACWAVEELRPIIQSGL